MTFKDVTNGVLVILALFAFLYMTPTFNGWVNRVLRRLHLMK